MKKADPRIFEEMYRSFPSEGTELEELRKEVRLLSRKVFTLSQQVKALKRHEGGKRPPLILNDAFDRKFAVGPYKAEFLKDYIPQTAGKMKVESAQEKLKDLQGIYRPEELGKGKGDGFYVSPKIVEHYDLPRPLPVKQNLKPE